MSTSLVGVRVRVALLVEELVGVTLTRALFRRRSIISSIDITVSTVGGISSTSFGRTDSSISGSIYS